MAASVNLLNAFNWIHVVFFVALALVYTWSWIRGGFWVPRYLHLIALVALFAGVIVTASLPPPANPNPLVNAVFPIIFPVFFVTSTYAVAIFCGFVHCNRSPFSLANWRS